MTEERKFAILFAATILAARKLIDMDPNKPNMAKGYFVDKAIDDAAFIFGLRIRFTFSAIIFDIRRESISSTACCSRPVSI